MSASKYAFTMHMSEEMWLDSLAMKYGGDFARRVKSRTETPPTEAEWALYREAVELLAKLEANPYFHVGGYDYELEVREPAPHVHIEYAETEAEYAARVRELNPDGYKPLPTLIERLTEAMVSASRIERDVARIEAAVDMPKYAMPDWPPMQTVQINTKADIK